MIEPITVRYNHTEAQPAVLALDFFGNMHHAPLSFREIAEQLANPSIVRIQIVDREGLRITLDKTWITKDIDDDAARAAMKAARKAFGRTGSPLAIRYGKGVMSKDGRTPYAAGTLHADRATGWRTPCPFTYGAFAALLADDRTANVELIDVDNVRISIRKKWVEVRSTVAERLAA